MKHNIINFSVLLKTLLYTFLVFNPHPLTSGALSAPFAAAEFNHVQDHDWINSTPLSINMLSGKVVMIYFWTFDCWNCYRSFPWLIAMEKRLQEEDFKVIGVHTPEFAHEKNRENIEKKVMEFKLEHPVMIDNDYSYWKLMQNRYWPAFYLLDKENRVRAAFFGETHEGDLQASRIEATIKKLLSEPI